MAEYPKLFKEFLELQGTLRHREEPTVKPLIRPKVRKMEEDSLTFDMIVAKKPNKKKVQKYLQNMIDDIVRENDDV